MNKNYYKCQIVQQLDLFAILHLLIFLKFYIILIFQLIIKEI